MRQCSVYGNSYNSALHEGKDRGEAQTYATLRAVSETALQNILGGISALGGKIPEALAGSIKNINNAAYRIAAKYGKSILSEGSEEYLQEILQPVIRNLAFGEDNKFRAISEDAAYAGLMGALTAGVFETGNIIRGESWDSTPPVTINKNPIIQDILKTENNVGELAKPYPKENLPKEVVEWIRKLPQYKDAIEISSTPSYEQISLLSRQEGVEFASITIGNRNIIIRGDTRGTPISKELLEDMLRNKGVLNCHSHPYIGDLQPSKSDLWLAQILSHQEEFEIITPDNMRAVYTKYGIVSIGNIPNTISDSDIKKYLELFGG